MAEDIWTHAHEIFREDQRVAVWNALQKVPGEGIRTARDLEAHWTTAAVFTLAEAELLLTLRRTARGREEEKGNGDAGPKRGFRATKPELTNTDGPPQKKSEGY